MNKDKETTRILGAQETFYYALNQASPKHFLIAAEIEGNTIELQWKTAIASLQKAHPILSGRITASDDNLYFESASDVSIPFESIALTQFFDLASVIEAELERGFRSDIGPLVRVKLFYSLQKCVVIIAAHHSIGDALSSVNLIGDLLQTLSGKTIETSEIRPSVDEFLGFENNGLAKKINRLIKPGLPLNHDFARHYPAAKVEILHLSKALTAHLAESSKKNNTTVHGALQAAAALSIKELSPDDARPAYIMSPFSIRKEMNAERDFGLFIDSKMVVVPLDQETDFWNIARSASAELAQVHNLELLKSSAGKMRGLIGNTDDLIQFVKDNFNFDIMLSNLGRISFDLGASSLKVNYIAGPFIIAGFNSSQAIGVATYDGNLVLANSSRYLVAGLLNAIESKLKEVCSL